MSEEWSFRTATGRARVAVGEVRVERDLRSAVRGAFETNWQYADGKQRVFFLATVLGFPSATLRLADTLLDGFRGTFQEVGLVVVFLLFLAAFGKRLYTDVLATTALPLADVERVVVDDAEGTVTLERDGDDRSFAVPRPDAREDAREVFELRGVTVVDADDSPDPNDGPEPDDGPQFEDAVGPDEAVDTAEQ